MKLARGEETLWKPTPFLYYFSTNLRFLRKVNGFTQKELAVLLHIDRSTYAYYEIGKTKPSFHAAAWLARFYQVTLDELLTINLKNHFLTLGEPKLAKIYQVSLEILLGLG